jgi:hypothetical protein
LTGSIGYTLAFSRQRDFIGGPLFASDDDQRHVVRLEPDSRILENPMRFARNRLAAV